MIKIKFQFDTSQIIADKDGATVSNSLYQTA